RSSPKPYLLALAAGAVWIGALVLIAWAKSEGDLRAVVSGLSALQASVGAAALFGPVVLFVIAAMLAVRAQEMRLVARAVGEVAVRLAEPESFSTDAVLTMSQTVRREVAAVGDGVERALARAGELETLVRGEIATLERAYSDNEIRIRSLVDELVAQREAIVTNAERVRSAITGSHQSLSQDLEGASDRIVSAVTGAGERVTGALETRGAAITASLGEAGDRVVNLMTARGSDLIDTLAATSQEVRGSFQEVGETLTRSFEDRAGTATGAFQAAGTALAERLSENAGALTRTLEETGSRVSDALERQAGTVRETFERSVTGLESAFLSRGSELTERFGAMGAEITARFAETGSALTQDIAGRGLALRAEIESAGLSV
ncbi:MAG: apolipoprotein A1/A4/E family protein, partial [Thermoleophilia bacterium]|nr:apolipoprotein A1/A4/E family protein [Thermoleophilia bacterium]